MGLKFYFIDLPACHCTNTVQPFHYYSVIQGKIRDDDSTGGSFIVENHFHCPGFFVIPDDFGNCS